jgi:hypothetical protein
MSGHRTSGSSRPWVQVQVQMHMIVCALVTVAAAGCGGADGVRRMRAVQPQEAGVSEMPFVCGMTNSLDCNNAVMLMPSGHVTNFGPREYSPSSGKWCDESGFHGSQFSFKGNNPMDANGVTIDAVDGSLKLQITASSGSYGGGGLAFESCLDASAFTGIQFSVAVSAGSLAGCTYQLQLQTFEQRPTSQSPPGGCDMSTTSCYGFPAAANLPAPSTDPANPTLVVVPFSRFSASVMPAPKQLVGLQWQVNASTGCTVELRIDDIDFIPATP